METWINNILSSGQSGMSALVAVFLLGLIGVFTCGCNYALFAVVVGYSGSLEPGRKNRSVIGSGISFLVGAIVSMAIIGAFFGYAGGMISASTGNYWKIIAGLLCVIFGLYSLDILPFKLPTYKVKTGNRKSGIWSSILFGLTVGGLATGFNSCCNPIFPIILATSFLKGNMLWGLIMLSVFALGYAVPLAAGLVGIRLGVGKLASTLSRVAKGVQYTGGILLILMGFYFLLTL